MAATSRTPTGAGREQRTEEWPNHPEPARPGVGTWRRDIRERGIASSPEPRRIFCAPRTTPLPLSLTRFSGLVHPDDRARVIASVSETPSSRRAGHAHGFRVLRPDGAARVLLSRARLDCDAWGRPLALEGLDADPMADLSELLGDGAGPPARGAVPGRAAAPGAHAERIAEASDGALRRDAAQSRGIPDNSASRLLAMDRKGRHPPANRHDLDAFGETEVRVPGRTDRERFGGGGPRSADDRRVA